MTEQSPSLEERIRELEVRLRQVEELLANVVEGLNEPPRRSLRHPFASINQLQVAVGEVNEDFQRLIDELHRPVT